MINTYIKEGKIVPAEVTVGLLRYVPPTHSPTHTSTHPPTHPPSPPTYLSTHPPTHPPQQQHGDGEGWGQDQVPH